MTKNVKKGVDEIRVGIGIFPTSQYQFANDTLETFYRDPVKSLRILLYFKENRGSVDFTTANMSFSSYPNTSQSRKSPRKSKTRTIAARTYTS